MVRFNSALWKVRVSGCSCSTAAAVFNLEKLTAAQAPAAGTNMTTDADLDAVGNDTAVHLTLSGTEAALKLDKGDKIAAINSAWGAIVDLTVTFAVVSQIGVRVE